jgi:hypothetical protein
MPVRITESQLSLLQENAERARKPWQERIAPRVKKRKEELPENILEKQILDFLQYRGWVVTRNQVGLYVSFREFAAVRAGQGAGMKVIPVRIGEKGMPDWRAQRIVPKTFKVEQFYFETKGPGRKPSPEQIEWIRKANAVGFLATWFDDFDGFVDSFVFWYELRFGRGNRVA